MTQALRFNPVEHSIVNYRYFCIYPNAHSKKDFIDAMAAGKAILKFRGELHVRGFPRVSHQGLYQR